jgi:hypothetical protein
MPSQASVVKRVRKRGADDTKTTALAPRGDSAGSTALDIARTSRADDDPSRLCAKTLAVLRMRSCSTWCGIDVPRPVRDNGGGRGAAPQAVRQLPRTRPARAVLVLSPRPMCSCSAPKRISDELRRNILLYPLQRLL